MMEDYGLIIYLMLLKLYILKKITVTDISEGMVNDARRNIECAIREASFTLNSNISQKFEYGI